MASLAKITGQWPSRPLPATPLLEVIGSSHAKVPSDAVSISQEKAAQLVDG